MLTLSPTAPFEELRTTVRAVLAESAGRVQGGSVRLDLGGRDLELFDLRRLLTVLKEHRVDVVGLHCTPGALHRYAERELKLKVYLHEAGTVPPPEPPAPSEESPTEIVTAPVLEGDDAAEEAGRRLLSINSNVRSGSVIRFGGDVHVFGDINPGGQVIAAGDIFVFGALRGLACAGAHGDDAAIVFALDMRPTQLRISKVIQITSGDLPERAARHEAPEVAWIHNGAIVIEPYRGRHPTRKEST